MPVSIVNTVARPAGTSPMFSAVMAAAGQANCTGNGTTATVIFGTEDYDPRSAYNNSTGIFTTPDDGIYLFSGSVTLDQLDTNVTSIQVCLVTTDNTYCLYSSANPPGTDQLPFAFSFICNMDALDTAKIQVTVAGMAGDTVDVQGVTNGTVRSCFQGFRLF